RRVLRRAGPARGKAPDSRSTAGGENLSSGTLRSDSGSRDCETQHRRNGKFLRASGHRGNPARLPAATSTQLLAPSENWERSSSEHSLSEQRRYHVPANRSLRSHRKGIGEKPCRCRKAKLHPC